MPRRPEQTEIAVLTERLNNFMRQQEEAHGELRQAINHFTQKIDTYFQITVGVNGSSRQYQLKDIILDHENKIKLHTQALEAYERRRTLSRLIEQHPRLSALIVILSALGLYFAGTQGLLIKLVTSVRPF